MKIIMPQAERPHGQALACMDCKKKLKEDEVFETCSHDKSYVLLCHTCYRKRGNSVR